MVGLFPTFFVTSSRHVLRPLKLFGIPDFGEQLKEYPSDLLEELTKVEKVIYKLASMGYKVQVVHSLSLLGFLLSIKHRLNRGFYVVAGGNVIKIEGEVNSLVERFASSASVKRKKRLRLKLD